MLCWMGFVISDPRHWVVDHIDGNPLNDQPSNLQVISQSENNRRSEKVIEQARKNCEMINARRREKRAALLTNPRAVNVASANPEIETTVDLQIELQLDTFLQQIYDN